VKPKKTPRVLTLGVNTLGVVFWFHRLSLILIILVRFKTVHSLHAVELRDRMNKLFILYKLFIKNKHVHCLFRVFVLRLLIANFMSYIFLCLHIPDYVDCIRFLNCNHLHYLTHFTIHIYTALTIHIYTWNSSSWKIK